MSDIIDGPGLYERRDGQIQEIVYVNKERYAAYGYMNSAGVSLNCWRLDGTLIGYWPDSLYHIARKAPPPPQKKFVPWESLSEIPRGAWFRRHGNNGWYRPVDINPKEQRIALRGIWLTLQELYERYDYTLDPFDDLPEPLPCGKEVEVTSA